MGLVVGMKDQETEEGQVIDHVTHPMNVLNPSSLHASEMLLHQQDNIKEVYHEKSVSVLHIYFLVFIRKYISLSNITSFHLCSCVTNLKYESSKINMMKNLIGNFY